MGPTVNSGLYNAMAIAEGKLSSTIFYGVDCQGNFVDSRGYLSLFHELFKVGI